MQGNKLTRKEEFLEIKDIFKNETFLYRTNFILIEEIFKKNLKLEDYIDQFKDISSNAY